MEGYVGNEDEITLRISERDVNETLCTMVDSEQINNVRQENIEPTKTRPKVGRKGVAYEKVWTAEEIENLIDLWRERPLLYDSSLPEYMDGVKRETAMNEISELLQLSENVVIRKMRSLRSYYGMLQKQIVETEKKGLEPSKPAWPFYDRLFFLAQTCSSRTRELKRRRTAEVLSHAPPKNEDIPQSIVVSTSTYESPKVDVNEDELFGQLVTRSLRKIPEGDAKEEAKIEIQQIILAAKKRALETK